MIKAIFIFMVLALGPRIGAFAADVVPGEPEFSASLKSRPMKKTYKWGLGSAVVVGDKLSCIAGKQTYLDPIPNPFHGDTHFSSEASEYAFVTYSIARGAKRGANDFIIPLGKYEQLAYDFHLLPGGTNVLVRKNPPNRNIEPITYQCWSLSPPGTNIDLSQQNALPLAPHPASRSRFLGSGYDAALFLSANGVLCLDIPGMTTNLNFTGQRTLDDYFGSLGTNVRVLRALVAGNLDYLVCYEEHLDPVRQMTAVLDLKTGKGVERGNEAGAELNVVRGELLFLKSHYEKISGKVSKHSYQIVSRTGTVRASLDVGLLRILAWSAGSPIVVFELGNSEQGRKSDLLVWNFQSGERWPITVPLPETLSK
jgi:hypothetical protein